MPIPRLRPRGCSTCSAPVNLLVAVRRDGRRYCCRSCAAQGRMAVEKARFDLCESSAVICRCSGVPHPLEATGRHCARCRRLFSAGVLRMLAEHRRAEERWTARLALRLEAIALRPIF